MRFILAGLCFFALAGPAAAQPAPSPQVLDQVYACANVTDESERLACYDAAVGRLRQAQTSGELVAVDRAQAEELNRDAFGFSLPSLPRIFGGGGDGDDPIDEVSMEIARVQPRPDGKHWIHMTNGQIWAMVDSAQSNRRAREGAQVTVRRAAVGSFMMSFGGGQAFRVRRQE
ncbi:MAG: hypothetical protein AB7P07_07200 [Hyphomonadaceae bacterium]